jgi:hypothetical protein
LQEVRQARGNGKERIDDQAEQILEALEARLAQRILMALLKEISDLAGKTRWVEIGQKAQQHLQQQQPPPEGRKALEGLVQVGKQFDGLAHLQTALDNAEKGRRAEAATLFGRADLLLQNPLRVVDSRSLKTLRNAEELLAVSGARWQRPPDVGRLKTIAANLRGALGDEAGASLLLQDLAMKSFLDGFAGEAVALLPDKPSGKHAAALLRDLKTLTQGEGRVSTWPAKQALAGGAKAGPPPGLRQLLPADQGKGWQEGIRQANPAEPVAVDRVAAVEKTLRGQVTEQAGKQRKQVDGQASKAMQTVRLLQQNLVQQDKDDEKVLAELEKTLQRKLVPAERVLVRQMRRQGKKAEDIRAALAGMKLAAK